MKIIAIVQLIFHTLAASMVFAQGSLTPPGTPAPTMKALDQIEARTDLNKLAGDATAVCVINGPGSYYLTADLSGVSGKDTIRVASTGRVTIDLNGFALINTGSGRTAIVLPAANDAVVIRNGTILAAGGTTTAAIGGMGTNVTCEDLRIVSSGSTTIKLGDNGTVSRCRLTQGGISLGTNSVVHATRVEGTADDISIQMGDDSQATDTQLVTGRGFLSLGARALVSDCRVNSGGPPTAISNGTVLQTGSSSVVRNCTVKGGDTVGNAIGVGSNSVLSHCRVSSVFRDGIVGQLDVTVESCAVENFGRHAIQLGANGRVRDCTVMSAGTGADGITVGDGSIVSGSSVNGIGGPGIIAGNACHISGCTVTSNDGNGIEAASHATILNCTARTNQGNGIVVAGSSLVRDCVVNFNGKKVTPINTTSDGIEVTAGRTRVVNCTIFDNALHGIHSTSTNNRNFIEGCLVHSNDSFGIFLQAGGGDTVIKNQVGGNGAGSINISGGNIAPLQNASTAVGSMHPLANFP